MKYEEIVKKWNEGADKFNQWDNLGADEQIEFAFILGRGADLIKFNICQCTEGIEDCRCCPEHEDNWRKGIKT